MYTAHGYLDTILSVIPVYYSPSIKALFMCLERRSEVCSVNPTDELLQFYSGFHQDLKNQLTHMVNTGNWEEIYDWFKNECPGMVYFIKLKGQSLSVSVCYCQNTVNSEIFARSLFSRNFAYAKFRKNKILAIFLRNHSIVY